MGISQQPQAAWWVVCVLSMAVTSLAHAQTGGRLRVQWSAPTGCPDAAEVEAQIRSRLPALDPALSVDIEAQVTRMRANAYQVHIRLAGTVTAERELEAESCAAAADATALLVALAIDPSRANPGADSTTRKTAGPPLAATPDPTVAPAARTTDATTPDAEHANEGGPDDGAPEDVATNDEAAESTDERAANEPLVLRIEAGAGVPIDWGTTPGITTGALLLVNVTLDRVLLVASGTWLVARETTIAPGATVSASWMSVALDGCYLAGAVTQWGPCLGVDLGQLTSTSNGLMDGRDRDELALFASGSLIARHRLTPALYASLWLGMRTSVWYPRFVVAGIGEAFQPAAIGLRATFALTLVLG